MHIINNNNIKKVTVYHNNIKNIFFTNFNGLLLIYLALDSSVGIVQLLTKYTIFALLGWYLSH